MAKTAFDFSALEQQFFSRKELTHDTALKPFKSFLTDIGEPHKKLPPTVHVAGTNGKGSTIAMMRAIYEAQGYKVHVITSPHLYDITERLVLASKQIKQSCLWEALKSHEALAKKHRLSWYEFLMGVSFDLCSKETADVMLLEVGLGGEFDATNVIESPVLSLITPISLDHSDFLGPHLKGIAQAKAGIIKEGCPSLSAQQPPLVQAILCKVAKEKKSLFRVVSTDCTRVPKPNLQGDHQQDNACLAVKAVSLLQDILPVETSAEDSFGDKKAKARFSRDARTEGTLTFPRSRSTVFCQGCKTAALSPSVETSALERGLKNIRWAGRLEWLGVKKGANLWFDVAHNPASSQAVHDFFIKRPGEKILIFALLKSKEARETLRPFRGLFQSVIFFEPQGSERYYAVETLAQIMQDFREESKEAASLQGALDQACSLDSQDILIAGSHYFAAEISDALSTKKISQREAMALPSSS